MFHVEDVRMNWQTSAKMVALTSVMTAMSFNAPSVTAQSKDLERTLAGVRLNASSRTVLSKFGNPNEIYIGDIGVRIPGSDAQQGGGMGMGMGDEGGMMGGAGMMGGMGGMMGGDTGGAVGAFGRTQSSVARQQEVTWVYNRTTKDAKGQTTAISYEFLINPGGSISQIRCLGYHSPIKPSTQTPSITTQKGIRLGSSYVEILRAYGQPDSYEKSGNILVLSYPKKHVQFQLINQKEQAEPTKAAYRVIAMTIATVEG